MNNKFGVKKLKMWQGSHAVAVATRRISVGVSVTMAASAGRESPPQGTTLKASIRGGA